MAFLETSGGAALISGIGSLLNSGFNSLSQFSSNERNEQLAREQNKWNLEQWYRENAYNTPTEQVKRLKAAGINPALMYAHGIDNIAAQSPQMVNSENQAFTDFNVGLGDAVNQFQQARMNESQISLNESQANKNNAEADELGTRSDANVAQKDYYNALVTVAEEQKKNLISERNKMRAEQWLKESEAFYQDIQNKYADSYFKNLSLKIEQEYNLSEAQFREFMDTRLARLRIIFASADESEINAGIANLNKEFIEKYGEKEWNLKLDKLASDIDMAFFNAMTNRISAVKYKTSGSGSVSLFYGLLSLGGAGSAERRNDSLMNTTLKKDKDGNYKVHM